MSLKKISVDFYFDYSCPWTYLGFKRLIQTATRTASDIIWKPINLEIMREILDKPKTITADYQKNYRKKDLQDWANYCNVVIKPMENIDHKASMAASRVVAHAEGEGLIKEYSEEIFKAFFSDSKDISDKNVLLEISEKIGLNGNLEDYLDDHSLDLMIEENSKELAQRGGYGSPTMFVENQMFFGNDRMNLVEFAIGQASGRVLVIPGQHNT
ncbi:MAG: DsbA family protein [Gammaproteobacteria bacterium]